MLSAGTVTCRGRHREPSRAIMAPASPVVQQNGAAKIKRPIPPGIQTNGITSLNSSPSPSMSHRSQPASAKQAPNSASDRSITASTVRPVNPTRRETSIQAPGRRSRDSAGMRTGSFSAGTTHHGVGLAPSRTPFPPNCTPKYQKGDSQLTKKYREQK